MTVLAGTDWLKIEYKINVMLFVYWCNNCNNIDPHC